MNHILPENATLFHVRRGATPISGGPKSKEIYLFWKTLFLIVFIFLLAGVRAQAPTGNPPITIYHASQTKINKTAWWIMQNRKGLVYVGNNGTKSHIAQYDGVTWQSIPDNSKDQNARNETRFMTEDSSGTIYYGALGDFGYLTHDTAGQTVCVSLLKYVPETERDFTSIWSIQLAGNSIYFQAREFLFKLTKSTRGKDTTWVCKTWKPQTLFMYSFYLNGVFYVHEKSTGLLRMQGDSLQLIAGSEFLGRDRVQVMLPFPNSSGRKEYLVGTFLSGMFLFDGKNFTPFPTEADKIMKGNTLYKAVKINKGFALGIMGVGVIIINREGKILQIINEKSGLINNAVTSLFWDGHRTLWVGTDRGVCKVELFSSVTRFFNQPGLSSSVNILSEMPDGTLYAGMNDGAARYNPVTNQFERIHGISGQVFFIIPDGNQALSGGNGFRSIRGNKLELIPSKTGKNSNAMVGGLEISKKYPNVLLGVFNVYVRDKMRTGGWKYWGQYGKLNITNPDGTLKLEDEAGRIWLSIDKDPNLYRFTLSVGGNGIPDVAKTRMEEIPINSVFPSGTIMFPYKNRIYFNDRSGTTYTFDDSLQKFVKDAVFSGTRDTILGSTMGVEGNRWIVSKGDKTLTLISSVTGERYILDSTVLALTEEVTESDTRIVHPGRNGIVWLSTLDGLIRVKTREPDRDTSSFSTLIRKVAFGGRSRDPEAEIGIHAPQIKFNDNSVRLDYAAPWFIREEETLYQTRLEGYDKGWSSWGKNSYKEYTNLPNGKYVFRVRAKNVYGTISSEAIYSFTILPPWYRTWWAYLIYALLITGAVWLIVYLRSRKLQKEKKILEEKVNDRTSELKKSLEELKSTQSQLIQSEKMASLGELTAGIAHEIQNPLNFVNNFSDINKELLEELKTKSEELKIENTDVKDLLNDIKSNEEKISLHGKRADGIVKSMLEHSRTSTGVKEPTDINKLADEYLRLAYHGMRAKDKDFNCEMKTNFDESLQKIDVVPQDIGRVLLNLFNNAFYAVNDKQKSESNGFVPTVTLITRKENNHVTITVTDNGSGIPEKIKDKIFQPFFTTKPTGSGTGLGLSLSYDIITKEHGGTIKVESEEGNGTTFIIQLEVQKN